MTDLIVPAAERLLTDVGTDTHAPMQDCARRLAAVRPPRPVGVQRRRTRGWRMPPNTVYVGRPSRFGNPWSVAEVIERGLAATVEDARRVCVDLYRDWLTGELDVYGPPGSPWSREAAERVLAALPALRGRNLACWCALDQPCHRNVLIDLANPA